MLRKQLTYITIFKPKNVEEWYSIANEVLNLNKDDALQLYDYVFDVPYTHLDIDTTNNHMYKTFNLLEISKWSASAVIQAQRKISTVVIRMNIKEINRLFTQGTLPPGFNFSKDNQEEIDWAKIKYNTFYKTPEFILERFPDGEGFLNLPGGIDILLKMADNMKSPLEDIMERQKMFDDSIEPDEENEEHGLDTSEQTDNQEFESSRLSESIVSESTETKWGFREIWVPAW